MNNKTSLIKLILAFLFIGCLFDLPYGFYQLTRFLGMVGFGLLAYDQYQKNQTWFVVWLASAFLINPLFKISLGKELWNIIDIVWAILLILSIFLPKESQKETNI